MIPLAISCFALALFAILIAGAYGEDMRWNRGPRGAK